MARGFNISVRATEANEINEGSLAAELEASGQLTELEKDGYLPAAIQAAKDLCEALVDGPFLVEFSGQDRTGETGEDSVLSVTVTSRYSSTPASVGEVEPETPSAFAARPEGSTVIVEGGDAGTVRDADGNVVGHTDLA